MSYDCIHFGVGCVAFLETGCSLFICLGKTGITGCLGYLFGDLVECFLASLDFFPVSPRCIRVFGLLAVWCFFHSHRPSQASAQIVIQFVSIWNHVPINLWIYGAMDLWFQESSILVAVYIVFWNAKSLHKGILMLVCMPFQVPIPLDHDLISPPYIIHAAYFPISRNPMAMLSMSPSTTRALLFWLSFSMSRRHSFNISSMVWYCLEEGPKVFRAFSRLFDIYILLFPAFRSCTGRYTLRKLSL